MRIAEGITESAACSSTFERKGRHNLGSSHLSRFLRLNSFHEELAMDVDTEPISPTGHAPVAREKVCTMFISGETVLNHRQTAPFLIRTFVKIGSFHRLTLFEDGMLPTTDEQQLFTW